MKRQIFRFVAVALVLMAGVTTVSRAATLDDITNRGVIRIGVDITTPPFGTLDEHMRPAGLDVDFANILAKDSGVKLDLVPITGKLVSLRS